MEKKTRIKMMYGFAVIFLLVGSILKYFNIGSPDFTIAKSVGDWLIYIGFAEATIATIFVIRKAKQVDERMKYFATKAQSISFLALILGAFVVIVIDGIQSIVIPYHIFMSYLICYVLLVYAVTYKILIRLN